VPHRIEPAHQHPNAMRGGGGGGRGEVALGGGGGVGDLPRQDVSDDPEILTMARWCRPPTKTVSMRCRASRFGQARRSM